MEIQRFEEYLAQNGVAPFSTLLQLQPSLGTQWVTHYIQAQCKRGVLGLSHIGNLLSGLKRFIVKQTAVGKCHVDPSLILRPGWQQFKAWRKLLPPEFRRPIETRLAVAISVAMASEGNWNAALCVLLMFHLLLRPEECLGTPWANMTFFSRQQGGVWGIFHIAKAKTRGSFAQLQSVLFEDQLIAQFAECCLESIPWWLRHCPIWPYTAAKFREAWDRALKVLRLNHLKLLPSGLRGGGACYHLLHYNQNLPRTRRRGRWRAEKTLEHYLQQAFSLMALEALSQVQLYIIEKVAALAASIFAPQ